MDALDEAELNEDEALARIDQVTEAFGHVDHELVDEMMEELELMRDTRANEMSTEE